MSDAAEVQEAAPDEATVLADRYIAMWNEGDGGRRRGTIAAIWSAGARYRDPLLAGDGHDGIDAMVQAVQDKYPGHRFRRTGPVERHNDRLRFAWELGAEGAAPMVTGVDFGVLDAEGRLAEITGFFDSVAAG